MCLIVVLEVLLQIVKQMEHNEQPVGHIVPLHEYVNLSVKYDTIGMEQMLVFKQVHDIMLLQLDYQVKQLVLYELIKRVHDNQVVRVVLQILLQQVQQVHD